MICQLSALTSHPPSPLPPPPQRFCPIDRVTRRQTSSLAVLYQERWSWRLQPSSEDLRVGAGQKAWHADSWELRTGSQYVTLSRAPSRPLNHLSVLPHSPGLYLYRLEGPLPPWPFIVCTQCIPSPSSSKPASSTPHPAQFP